MERLLQRIEADGLTVVALPMTVAGRYLPDVGAIAIDCRLTAAEARCTLAHEWCHHRAGHACGQPPAIEAIVDEQAARMLVSPAEYALAERLVGPDVALLAEELDLTPRYVKAFRRALGKRGARAAGETS